ncbi:MAG TPA: hypothetical protein ENI87_15320 [bacterium]|nr:hypothetical protein [bacterium]
MKLKGHKLVVACCGFIAFGVSGMAGVTVVARRYAADELEASRANLQSAVRELARASDDRDSAPGDSEACPYRLLAEPDVVGTLRDLNRLGSDAGITIDSQQALKTSDKGKQSYVVSGRGRPTQVCRFLAAIEKSERLLVVETGRVVPADAGEVAFEVGLATYQCGERQ